MHATDANRLEVDQMPARQMSADQAHCQICDYHIALPDTANMGHVRGNTERFRQTSFRLWKCPRCQTIYSLDPVDFRDIYIDYPLNRRRLDVFTRGTFRNLLRRLERAGLQKSHSILDYGCGNGIFVEYLRQTGYSKVSGYDPYVADYAKPPEAEFPYDCVIANDVIEHCADARAFVRDCVRLIKPGGLFYLGTADSSDVDMGDLGSHLMRLHQPFHRLIVTQNTLINLGTEIGLEVLRSYRRSYMDTCRPFSSYRFLDEFNKALGYNLDRALDPSAGKILLWNPKLWFYAFFGYWLPSAYEPAVVFRR